MSSQKGKELMHLADKKLNEFSLFSIFNKNGKLQEAADIYIKAAAQFKIAKLWDNCAEAYEKAAELLLQLGDKHEAATMYINISNAYRKGDSTKAPPYLQKASQIYEDEGRFPMVGKCQKEIGELYEEELEYEKSIEAFQKAADTYEAENQQATANGCLVKVATMYGTLSKFERAIEIYEKLGKSATSSNLGKFGAKEHFFKAGLLYLANGDVVSAKKKIDSYKNIDLYFEQSRECEFLSKITVAVDELDIDEFTKAVVEFDNITKLDQWKTNILLKIKNSIKNEDNTADDDLA